MLHFDRDDLHQFSREYFLSLVPNPLVLVEVAFKLTQDLAEARDCLAKNPTNSSLSPSSRFPWERSSGKNKNDETEKDEQESEESPNKTSDKSVHDSSDNASDNTTAEESPEAKEPKPNPKQKRKPGKQHGAKGFGRTQKLMITETIIHRPEYCKACNAKFDEKLLFHAKGGHYTIDLKRPEQGMVGLHGICIKHIYGTIQCEACRFETTTKPHCAEAEPGWVVEMGEHRLIGPLLLAFLVYLKFRSHMTVSKIRDFLLVWMGLSLSDGCINTATREAGRAASSLEPQLIDLLQASGLLHVDETPWKEHKITRWLWVAVGDGVVYYTVGPRSSETAEKILSGFQGWIMTDGYGVYRQHEKRLRCWTHIERKAKGLEESWNKDAANFGAYAVKTFKTLREGVYKMRELSPKEREAEAKNLDEKRLELIVECIRKNDSEHEVMRAFAVEILNDIEAIFRVLKNPELPLTNNRAEQILRNSVILRNMCHGSKTEEGSRTVAILYSVIDTLQMRKVDAWEFLSTVIRLRRSGSSPPPIPAAA